MVQLQKAISEPDLSHPLLPPVLKHEDTGTPKFRVDRAGFGLTYSCPTSCKSGHPIKTKEELLMWLQSKGPCKYSIGFEPHKVGPNGQLKMHFHAYVIYDSKIETTNPRYFDFKEVHPNIVKGKPGVGFLDYTQKNGDFITNVAQDAYTAAMACKSAEGALELLWKKRTADMCKFGDRIERNVRARFAPRHVDALWYGPYPEWWHVEWDQTKALQLTGEPGIHKTQYAKYLLGGRGHYFCVNNSTEVLKEWDRKTPLIFNDINFSALGPDMCKAITDVVEGGVFTVKHGHVNIPPGIPRIFTHNVWNIFDDSQMAVYHNNRRVQRFRLLEEAPIKIPLGASGSSGTGGDSNCSHFGLSGQARRARSPGLWSKLPVEIRLRIVSIVRSNFVWSPPFLLPIKVPIAADVLFSNIGRPRQWSDYKYW
jgi:hypothetical protein